jgi:hypothetical protein
MNLDHDSLQMSTTTNRPYLCTYASPRKEQVTTGRAPAAANTLGHAPEPNFSDGFTGSGQNVRRSVTENMGRPEYGFRGLNISPHGPY